MAARQVVALLGLPGAGKTTVLRTVHLSLGWAVLSVGETLRAKAKEDPELASLLAAGTLAPEHAVAAVVREFAGTTHERGLMVDGFPRHKQQIDVADEAFGNWTAILLAVPLELAKRRLALRADGGPPRPGSDMSTNRSRPEDHPTVVERRIADAAAQLSVLETALRDRGRKLTVIDGSLAPTEILSQVVEHLHAM
jgi:adenylate kinase family enzyme